MNVKKASSIETRRVVIDDCTFGRATSWLMLQSNEFRCNDGIGEFSTPKQNIVSCIALQEIT